MRKLLAAALLLFPLAAHAQWQQMTVDSQTVDVLLPQNYNPAQSYPLVEFLHQNGMGCCQSALEGEFTSDFQAMQAQHPSIVIMPLLNQTNGNGGQTINFGGVGQDGGGEQFALDAVAMAERQFNVNKAQVLVTGASMGGQGTDQLMVDHGPNSAQPIYAAGLSMAGTMINDQPSQAAQQLGNAPIIAVHGSDDTSNLPGWDDAMAQADPNFHLTTLQGTGHDVWDGSTGYSDMSLWNQLFGYTMNGQAAPLSLSSSALKAAGSVTSATLGTPAPASPSIPESARQPASGSVSTNAAPHSATSTAPVVAPTTPSPSAPPPASFTPDPNVPRTIGSAGCGQNETGAGTGQFSVQGGRIIDPNGSVFIVKGINADQTDDPATIRNLFPGLNFVRLAIGQWNGGTLGSVQSFVQAMTSYNVVVEIEDHPWNGGDNPQPAAYTGGQLAAETAVYAQLAAAYKDNPYVWFGTMNEPQWGAVADQEVAIYNAIRGAGSNAILMMEAGPGAGIPGQMGAGPLPAGDYAGMHNVAWDFHFYNWITQGSADQTVANNALVGSASGSTGVMGLNTIKSADGQIPVIVGEFGPNCCAFGGSGGDQIVNTVTNFGPTNNYTQGFAGWEWMVGDPNTLTNGGKSLTDWGNTLSMAVASSCQQLAPSIAGTATSVAPASTQQPNTAIAVSAPASSTPTLAPDNPLSTTENGMVPTITQEDTDQSFQQGTADATQTISGAVSAVDAAAQARMQ